MSAPDLTALSDADLDQWVARCRTEQRAAQGATYPLRSSEDRAHWQALNTARAATCAAVVEASRRQLVADLPGTAKFLLFQVDEEDGREFLSPDRVFDAGWNELGSLEALSGPAAVEAAMQMCVALTDTHGPVMEAVDLTDGSHVEEAPFRVYHLG